jgi:glycine/D-amino acid oxidase-like deaminating enzyme
MQAATTMFSKICQIFTIIIITSNMASSTRSHVLRSSVSMTTVPMPRVVVLGAGIHGASVAYYLSSKFGILPTVVERVSVAAAASGKAGGFLAREWGTGATVEISRVSFDMHEKLGEWTRCIISWNRFDHGIDWYLSVLRGLIPLFLIFSAAELNIESYRHVKTLSVDGNRKGKADATWLDRQAASSVLDSGKLQRSGQS